MSSSESLPSSLHGLVEQGTTAVQEIHQIVADAPFKILETLTPFDDALGEIRDVQTRSIGAVYGIVRKVNDRVEQIAEELLSVRA